MKRKTLLKKLKSWETKKEILINMFTKSKKHMIDKRVFDKWCKESKYFTFDKIDYSKYNTGLPIEIDGEIYYEHIETTIDREKLYNDLDYLSDRFMCTYRVNAVSRILKKLGYISY